MRRWLSAVGCIAVIGLALQAPKKHTDPTPAIEQLLREFAASLTAGNADRWIALWAEDGIQLPPDAPPVEGKSAIASKIRGILAQFQFDMSIQNVETHPAGEWAFARGKYQAKLTPKNGGPPVPIDGKYLTVLRKQRDGSWKIYRDIFNSNVPPGKPN